MWKEKPSTIVLLSLATVGMMAVAVEPLLREIRDGMGWNWPPAWDWIVLGAQLCLVYVACLLVLIPPSDLDRDTARMLAGLYFMMATMSFDLETTIARFGAWSSAIAGVSIVYGASVLGLAIRRDPTSWRLPSRTAIWVQIVLFLIAAGGALTAVRAFAGIGS